MDESGQRQGLYESANEHDACGVGMVADLYDRASHAIVKDALGILKRLTHRGATGNDPLTGDGAGILLKIPDAFFRKTVPQLEGVARYGVAMVFGGEGEEAVFEETIGNEGGRILAWRDVPVDPSAVGPVARSVMPRIRQVFIGAEGGADFERKLFVMRRLVEKKTKGMYICSMSSRTVVYKGLLLAAQAEEFYPDLKDGDFATSLALVHQRYSTNTFPTWELAHPFRCLAHNGEINTLRGNLNALKAREKLLKSDLFGEDLAKLLPLVKDGQSDSASLDNMFELLVAAGREAPHAMMMLMPQAWGAKYAMGHDARGFYEYHSALMEPWDGPAAVAFTDGINAGAALDRNGLRPARWTLAKNGLFVLASETGVLDIAPQDVVRHGRLRPGALVYLDLVHHRLMEDAEIKTFYARRKPYRRWVAENRIPVQGLFAEITPAAVKDDLAAEHRRFGYTDEDVRLVISPMAENGQEPVGSMGNDAALAVLSRKPRLLFDYFRQLFAQVTNPPIDPIREELVMSIMTYIGNVGNILDEGPQHARIIKLQRPVLTDDDVERLQTVADRGYPAVTLPMSFAGDMERALAILAQNAVQSVKAGARIVVLSDRNLPEGEIPIPSLLATAAVNRALVDAALRSETGLVVSSGEVREVMHYALLLGYGATAINPWLALETVVSLNAGDPVGATTRYVKAVDKGLLKIMSKMGISTLRSYRGAQIFEAVGLGRDIVEKYFTGTASRVDGIGLEEIAEDARRRAAGELHDGEYRWRKDGEDHLWTPETLTLFRQAVREGDEEKFLRYEAAVNDLHKHRVTLRSLFAFKKTKAVPLNEVESTEEIIKHFVGGAMSLGSLSPEAHETIAQALNGLGTMSNCGEGGENAERFGTDKNCGIKQVASGRFGVTIDYLRNAKDIQIKLAQGAKPGEGGQLPAHKVNRFVASLRHSMPGVTLISPPPHHDIYSIEDLAQLIYDLHCANPAARVSVKLVSEAGVGTIAAGVAKAKADVVLVSGGDGGTGAAPLSSMKHAGIPWELGLAETQQTLVKNNLRGSVRVQVDGQLKTARDVVIGAILGANEFGFGTTMLVALGCIQDRRCHCNTCPVGIATQDACLRQKFSGKKEHLQNFFRFLAADVRRILAALGLRSLDEAIGRTDLLETLPNELHLDFSRILLPTHGNASGAKGERTLDNYDRRELLDACAEAVAEGKPVVLKRTIRNENRTAGTELSGEIAARHGAKGLPEGTVTVDFTGVAGQSFGAFLAHGVTFNLRGEANDYVGKGLSGGIITLAPPKGAGFAAEENVLAGNVIAYGATEGAIYINGQAGERFGVRNSGATLVAEGIGDHGCEYMTGGRVVILGKTGVNFAAGMTGGLAYIYDERGNFDLSCNLAGVDLETVEAGTPEETELKAILAEHFARTGSPKAKALLDGWLDARAKFTLVFPVEYKAALAK